MTASQPPGTAPVCVPLLDRFAEAFAVTQRRLLGQWRTALALWQVTADRDREFVAGQLAIVMNVHPQTAQALLADV